MGLVGGAYTRGVPLCPRDLIYVPRLPSASNLALELFACMGESPEILLSPVLSSPTIYAMERVGGPRPCPKVNSCPSLSFRDTTFLGTAMRPCDPSGGITLGCGGVERKPPALKQGCYSAAALSLSALPKEVKGFSGSEGLC